MHDWNQTPTTITVSIALPYRVDPKKLESTITENYIKLNIPEIKLFKFIDLYDNIDMGSSNVVVEDKKILYYLIKLKEEKWPQLEFKAESKEALKQRRKIAEDNYNAMILKGREDA